MNYNQSEEPLVVTSENSNMKYRGTWKIDSEGIGFQPLKGPYSIFIGWNDVIKVRWNYNLHRVELEGLTDKIIIPILFLKRKDWKQVRIKIKDYTASSQPTSREYGGSV